MAKRYSMTKSHMLYYYGDVVLSEHDLPHNNEVSTMEYTFSDGHSIVASVNPNRESHVIFSSLKNLVERGHVDEVYVQFPAGQRGPDAITYKWTSKRKDDWEGTYSDSF